MKSYLTSQFVVGMNLGDGEPEFEPVRVDSPTAAIAALTGQLRHDAPHLHIHIEPAELYDGYAIVVGDMRYWIDHLLVARYTAWLTNDPSMLPTGRAEVDVLRDRPTGTEPEEWVSDGTPVFSATLDRHHTADPQALAQAAGEALAGGGWDFETCLWEPVPTGYVTRVVPTVVVHFYDQRSRVYACGADGAELDGDLETEDPNKVTCTGCLENIPG